MICTHVHKELLWCSLCVKTGICPCGKLTLKGIWTTTKKTKGGQGKLQWKASQKGEMCGAFILLHRGEMTNAHKILVGKSGGMRPLTRHRCQWEKNLQFGLTYGVQSIHLPVDKNQLGLFWIQQWTPDFQVNVILSNVTIFLCISPLLCASFYGVLSDKEKQ